MARANAREVDETAASWVARLDRGLSPGETEALEAWLAADTRHLGAFGRMQAVFQHTERAAELAPPEGQGRSGASHAHSRRGLLQAGGAAIAVAAGGAALWIFDGTGRFSTRTGEVRVVALKDGSVVTLNTDSTVTVRYSGAQRSIELIAGEALFDVAKDASRPFVVAAGDVTVRATGTSFTVRRLAGAPVEILVQEGAVEVRRPDVAPMPPVLVSQNMRATAADLAPVEAALVSPGDVQRALIWRQGRIAFEGDTLLEAAAEFARYSETRIVIDDPELAREEISGSFQANDPVGFGRAVAEAFGVQVRVGEGEVRLLR